MDRSGADNNHNCRKDVPPVVSILREGSFTRQQRQQQERRRRRGRSRMEKQRSEDLYTRREMMMMSKGRTASSSKSFRGYSGSKKALEGSARSSSSRSSKRKTYKRRSSSPGTRSRHHHHHSHHRSQSAHHNALIQKNHKGENPMDKYEKVRELRLHPHTELHVVRPQDNTYDHQEYILKYIRLGNTIDPHALRQIRNEISSIRMMDHPAIVDIFDVYEYNKALVMVMEHCPEEGGPIWWQNAACKRYSEEEAGYMIFKILNFVKYMHDHKVIHGDLRPEVIVFERKQNCGTSSSRSLAELQSLKLIDFGFNRFEDDEIRGRNTEEDFEECRYCQAPEALCREKLSYKSDIWSVGVIAYVLLSGRLPFRDESDLTSIWGNSVHINFGSTFWKEQVSAEAKDFITQALQLEEENRMDTVQAQQHPWMRKCAKATEGDLQLDPELLKGVADHLVEFAKEPRLKRAALTIIARHAHSEEVTQLRSVFEHFDEDKNGSITRGELHTALRRMHVSNEQIMDIFDSLDFDGDTSIEYSEFLGAVLEFYQEVKKDDLNSAFTKIAGEGNECITARRLVHFFDVGMQAAQKMLSDIDMNSNGRISFDEFYYYFRRGSKSKEVREKRLAAQRQRELRAQQLAEEQEKQRLAIENPEQRRYRLMKEALGGSDHDKQAVRNFLESLGSEKDINNRSTSSNISSTMCSMRQTWNDKHHTKAVIPAEIDTSAGDEDSVSSSHNKKKKKSKRKLLKKVKSERSKGTVSTKKSSQSDQSRKRTTKVSGKNDELSRSEPGVERARSAGKSSSSRSKRSQSVGAALTSTTTTKPRSLSPPHTSSSSSGRRLKKSSSEKKKSRSERHIQRSSSSHGESLSNSQTKKHKRKKSKKRLVENNGNNNSFSSKNYSSSEEEPTSSKKKEKVKSVLQHGTHDEKRRHVQQLLEEAIEQLGKSEHGKKRRSSSVSGKEPILPSASKLKQKSRAELRAESLLLGTLNAVKARNNTNNNSKDNNNNNKDNEKRRQRSVSAPRSLQSPRSKTQKSPTALAKSKYLLASLAYKHHQDRSRPMPPGMPAEMAVLEAWNGYKSRVVDRSKSPTRKVVDKLHKSTSSLSSRKSKQSQGSSHKSRGRRADKVSTVFQF